MNHQCLQIGSQIIPPEDILSLVRDHLLLPQLVKEIIIDQAIANITCTVEEEEQAKNLFLQQNQLNSEEKLHHWLKNHGLEIEQFPQIATRNLKIEKFKRAEFTHQIESYFVKRKAQLDQVIYSLIRVNNGAIAQELYFRIVEGEQKFEEIARQYSQGVEAQTGGLMGPVELAVPHPAIAQRLRVAQVGQVAPPLRIHEWWVILRLEKSIPAQLDQGMRQKLLNELFTNWLDQQSQENFTLFTPKIALASELNKN